MMLHTKYHSSRPRGFRENFKFYVENLSLGCVTLICNGAEPFEQFLKRAL